MAHPGAHDEARELSDALAKEPDRIDLRLRRGECYRQEGRLADSLADFDRVRQLAGESRVVSLERGLTLSAMRRDEEAEAELTDYLSTANPRAIAYAERAQVRRRHHRIAEAIDDYASAIALRPNVEWYVTRGRLQESLGKLEDAAKGYRDGLSRCDGAVAIRLELIRLESSRNHFDDAIALIDGILSQADVKTDWYLRRAEINAAAGRPDDAGRDRALAWAEADRAVARRPTATRLIARAKVAIALDRRDRAAADLKAALRKGPAQAEAMALLKSIEDQETPKGPATHAIP